MISQEFTVISKIEAAERQLDQAILLFYQRGDAVSIHTLAAASYQIAIDVCKQRGFPRELEDSVALDQMGVKNEVLAAVRRPQNFFKHAEKPEDQTVQLNPMLSVVLMMGTTQYLLTLGVTPSAEREVFRTWFLLRLTLPLESVPHSRVTN